MDSEEEFLLGNTQVKTVDEESEESEEEIVPVVDALGRLTRFRIAIIQRTAVRVGRVCAVGWGGGRRRADEGNRVQPHLKPSKLI